MAKYTENLNLETPEYTDDADIPALIEKNNNILDEVINSKANLNDVPTKISELENDKDFVTANGDVIKTLQNKKAELIELLTVSDTAPSTCSIGDKYYNTTTNKIYTAIADNTWESTGDDPSSVFLYVDLTNSKLWFYDGTYFKTYGGGSGGGDTLPMGTILDYDGTVVPSGFEEVTDFNVYTTDEIKTNKIWIDGRPIYRKVIYDTTNRAVGNYSIPSGISNLKELIKFEVLNYQTEDIIFMGNATTPLSGSERVTAYYQNGNINIRSSWVTIKTIVTLEYTKKEV